MHSTTDFSWVSGVGRISRQEENLEGAMACWADSTGRGHEMNKEREAESKSGVTQNGTVLDHVFRQGACTCEAF